MCNNKGHSHITTNKIFYTQIQKVATQDIIFSLPSFIYFHTKFINLKKSSNILRESYLNDQYK